ncbi:cilia- and flagella-associated protein 100-like isoform X1 [Clarias gariepinus]|uniref:cilia- and flagella-associated protein 100-like isoform X1 n=1 Tax=Clarias gariepinus TaxID=13013 RepID=UPI00234D4895|nr:cilia- and flagella-associated protein 100-like isoform X1 [Clarias gariepinus]
MMARTTQKICMGTESEKGSIKMTSSNSNAFSMPGDFLHFSFQEKEKKRQDLGRQLNLKAYERGVKPRESTRAIVARYLQEIEEEEGEKEEEERERRDTKIAPLDACSLPEWEYHHMASVRDFVDKEREICQLEYSISVSQKRVQGLKNQMPMNEAEMAKAEASFGEEAFEKYVKEKEENTVLALKTAEEGTKALLLKREEIQRTSNEVVKIKKEIARYEEMMRHYQMCQEFLWNISPPQWQKQQETRKQIAEKIKAAAHEREQDAQADLPADQISGLSTALPPTDQNSNSKASQENCKNSDKKPEEDLGIENLEFYEKPQLYFTDRKQLLAIMLEMEEQTNHLFQELDYIERSLESGRQNEVKELKQLEMETARLNEQMDCLTKSINENKEKAAEIQEKIESFQMSEDAQNAVLEQLYEKIKEVYRVSMGCAPENQTSCQLLGSVEMCLYDLLEKFDRFPEDDLKTIKKEYRRDYIARIRKKEKHLKLMAQEERRRHRAAVKLQQAQAEFKKPVGKKEMWRSWVEKKVPKVEEEKDVVDKHKQEDDNYFFS